MASKTVECKFAWCKLVPLYKGKGDKWDCSNLGGINLFSVVGKLYGRPYGRVLIKRVRAGTECAIGEKQCGFKQGRGCTDEVFAVMEIREKYPAKGKTYFGCLWIWRRPMI